MYEVSCNINNQAMIKRCPIGISGRKKVNYEHNRKRISYQSWISG